MYDSARVRLSGNVVSRNPWKPPRVKAMSPGRERCPPPRLKCFPNVSVKGARAVLLKGLTPRLSRPSRPTPQMEGVPELSTAAAIHRNRARLRSQSQHPAE
eukprot:604378-Prymnesium_polylepis.1